MMNPEQLSQFGKVEICREENQTFHIKITDGFNPKLSNYTKVLDIVSDHFDGKYTDVISIMVKENHFEYIIK